MPSSDRNAMTPFSSIQHGFIATHQGPEAEGFDY